MNKDEVLKLAQKFHITDAYEYGSGASDEDVIDFANTCYNAGLARGAEIVSAECLGMMNALPLYGKKSNELHPD